MAGKPTKGFTYTFALILICYPHGVRTCTLQPYCQELFRGMGRAGSYAKAGVDHPPSFLPVSPVWIESRLLHVFGVTVARMGMPEVLAFGLLLLWL